MIISEVDLLFQFQVVRIHLSIKTMVLFEHTRQGSYPSIDSAPVSYTLPSVDFWHDILEMLLAE
jgi:hypothetical protein